MVLLEEDKQTTESFGKKKMDQIRELPDIVEYLENEDLFKDLGKSNCLEGTDLRDSGDFDQEQPDPTFHLLPQTEETGLCRKRVRIDGRPQEANAASKPSDTKKVKIENPNFEQQQWGPSVLGSSYMWRQTVIHTGPFTTYVPTNLNLVPRADGATGNMTYFHVCGGVSAVPVPTITYPHLYPSLQGMTPLVACVTQQKQDTTMMMMRNTTQRLSTNAKQLQLIGKLGKSSTPQSNFRGVSWHRRDKKWVARTSIDKEITHLGSFRSETLAALVVDLRRIDHYGFEGVVNFPRHEERSRLINHFLSTGELHFRPKSDGHETSLEAN